MNEADHLRAIAERDAARRSETLLRELMQGGTFSCSSKDLERVYDQAFASIAKDVPDPAVFARELMLSDRPLADALAKAWRVRSGDQEGLWRVDENVAVRLRSIGIVGAGGPFLGAFGNAVRQALLSGEWAELPPGEEMTVHG